ncbi:MAG: glycosyltransferase family 4 protein [Bacteroidales bacterium]|nr:glycosyltransferase family 4 protein [Bacteroidales bacterium]
MTKLLFIRYKKNNGILDGGEQVTEMHYYALSEIVGKANIDTYYVHDENQKRTICDYLNGVLFFPFNYHFGLTPKKVKQLCSKAQSFDVVFIDRSVFGIIAKKLKESGYRGRIITFFHNAEASYFDAKLPKHLPFRNIIIRSADHNDAFSFKYSDKAIVLNRRDDDVLSKQYGKRADTIIPIVFRDKLGDTTNTHESTREKPECLFIGSYFAPNNEGIVWFAKNVLPNVNITMKVVGKGMDRLKNEESILRDVEVIGNVPDLSEHIKEADIMVLPIFKGSGMKVKTCESLMYGKNIIGTDEAFEGYTGDFDQIGGKCNTAKEFIETLNDFIAHPRPKFNAYSRQLFLEHHSEAVMMEKLGQLLSES